MLNAGQLRILEMLETPDSASGLARRLKAQLGRGPDSF
jgi:hypothetical protein